MSWPLHFVCPGLGTDLEGDEMHPTNALRPDVSDMLAVHAGFPTSRRSARHRPMWPARPVTPNGVVLVADFYDNVLAFLHVHHERRGRAGHPPAVSRGRPRRTCSSGWPRSTRPVLGPIAGVEATLGRWRADPDPAASRRAAGGHRRTRSPSCPRTSTRSDRRPILAPTLHRQYLIPRGVGRAAGPRHGQLLGDKIWLILGLIYEQMSADQQACRCWPTCRLRRSRCGPPSAMHACSTVYVAELRQTALAADRLTA